MSLWLKLAWRNLARNLRRTVITVLAIAFGLVFCDLSIVMATGTYREMTRVGVSSLAGHVVVQAKGYEKKQDPDLVVTGVAALVDQLRQRYPEATVAPRMALVGLLTSPTGSVGVGLMGVDGAAEARVQDVDDQVKTGTWLDGGGRGIVVGQELAKSLSVGVGDKVVFMGQFDGALEVQSRLFRVIGTFRSGSADLDGFVAFADLPAVQAVFGRDDVANRVTVHLTDLDQSDRVAGEVRAALADRSELDVLTWQQALPEIWGVIQIDKTSNMVLLLVAGAIVAMGVLNTVLMSVLERAREFGVMLALGLEPSRLAGTILLEGLFLGLIGAVVGGVLGVAVCWPLIVHGVDYTSFVGSDTIESSGIAISAKLQPAWDWVRMAKYSIGGVLFTGIAAIYPAVFVARLRPVAAMHHT